MTRAHRAVFTTLVWLIPLLFPVVALSAQTRDERAVRTAVEAFFAAIEREQWDSAATFIDLPRFEPILRQQIAWARSALPQPPATAEQFMADDSTMPRAVADWEAKRSNRYRSQRAFDDYSSQFAGVSSQHLLFWLSPLAIAFQDDSTAFVIQSDDRLRGEALMSNERVMPVRLTHTGWRIEPREDLLSPRNVFFSSECPKK